MKYLWINPSTGSSADDLPPEAIDLAGEDWEIIEEPFECWVNLYPNGLGSTACQTKYEAEAAATGGLIRCVHMKEVIE